MGLLPQPVLRIVPVTLQRARDFVTEHHRHNAAPRKWKFGVGCELGGVLVGVAIASRPIAPALDDGFTLEVTRTCTTGVRNANSMLYGAIVRAGKAMGYKRFVTYTQHDESGASLRAVGWVRAADLPPRKAWDCPSRPRKDNGTNYVARVRWEHRVES